MKGPRCWLGALVLTAMGGCQGTALAPLATVAEVDLERFMGDWYVIASIPTPFERDAFNAIERYEMNEDGSIATTFSYNKGGFDGPRKTMHAKGFVRDTAGSAVWGMQFIWPIRADYRIVYLDDEYSTTIIGRNQRDYVWIMARAPDMDETVLAGHIRWLDQVGYDTAKLIRIAHREVSAAAKD
jgi:apolipoprotein D and lipocalin family protein